MNLDAQYKVLDYVKSEVLLPGERIAWRGRPGRRAGVKFGYSKILGSIFFTAFSLFWLYNAYRPGSIFWLFGLPFLGAGVWMLVAPLRKLNLAAHTYYAITDQRVLILTTGRHFKVNSIHANEITDYERTDMGDGRGSIQLRKSLSAEGKSTTYSAEFKDGLWEIDDVKSAARIIAKMRGTEG